MTKSNDGSGGRVDLNAQTRISTPEQENVKTRHYGARASDAGEQATHTHASIGEYRIIRKIGEGGMGVVYEAEQQNPHRLVALKVIRGGLHADDYHVKMFEREIEALARLKHPGIASIYESGRTDDGTVFFAMELVNGVPLDNFVEKQRSVSGEGAGDIRSQLALFAQIGDVVSHAHQRGVIHRDLKPQNILVTDDGDMQSLSGDRVGVKILDFGLARINDPDFRGNTGVSQVGQIKGTLLYMSPEQVRGSSDEIDVRSDVYSLGVMLFEMLTGRMPYDLSSVSLPEAMRIICEDPPLLPSKALSETMGTGRRSARIDVDVETIILKALEKEPDRRYQSVAAMLDDVERYLRNEPILARPPSPVYQFKKLVARHKLAFASIATIFLLVAGFGVVMAAQSVRIANERDKAEAARIEAEEQKTQAEQSRNEALTARNEEAKQRQIAVDSLARAEQEQKRAEEEKTKAEIAQKAEAEQRRIAVQNLETAQTEKHRAEEQTEIATKQRMLADERKIAADAKTEQIRQILYASQISLAQRSVEQGDVQLKPLLESLIPTPGQADLRGFEWYYLWRQANRNSRTYENLGSGATADVEFWRDTILLTNGSDLTAEGGRVSAGIRLIDIESGEVTKTIKDRLSVAHSPSTRQLAVVDGREWNSTNPRTVSILNLDSGTELATDLTWSHRSSFSPDGKLLAVTVAEGQFKVQINIAATSTGKTIRSIPIDGNLLGLTFSPNGRTLAASILNINPQGNSLADLSTKLMVLDVETARTIHTMEGDYGDFHTTVFSPDGQKIFSSGGNGSIKVWDSESGRRLGQLQRPQTQTFGTGLGGFAISPEGRFLVRGTGLKLQVLDTLSGAEVGAAIARGLITAVAFAPDGKSIATSNMNRQIEIWPLPLDMSTTTLANQLLAVESPTGDLLVTTDYDGKLTFWSAPTYARLESVAPSRIDPSEIVGQPRKEASPTTGPSKVWFTNPRFLSQDILAISRSDSILELWDVNSRKRVVAIHPAPAGIAFSETENLATLAGRDGVIRRFHVGRREFISTVETGIKADQQLLSANGKILAALQGQNLSIFDASTGQRKVVETSAGQRMHKLTHDGKSLVVGRPSELAQIDTDTGKTVLSVSAPGGRMPVQIIFSPTGDTMAYSLGGDKIFLVDTSTGSPLREIGGIGQALASMAISPDSKRLATATTDAVSIWEVASGRLLLRLPPEFVYEMQFSKDGRSLMGAMIPSMTVRSQVPGVIIWRGATDEEVARQRGK
jgi:serine/threonine protein kinase/WD40 repeat protein